MEIKWVAIMLMVIFGGLFAAIAVDKYSKGIAQKACYENHGTNCETLK